MNIINKQLYELKSSIQAFTDSPTVGSVDASKPNLPRKSYADITATDIQVAQNAVAQGFKIQEKDDCIEKTIVIYGLPELKNDIIHIRKLLEDNLSSKFIVSEKLLPHHLLLISLVCGRSTDSPLKMTTKMDDSPLKMKLAFNKDRDWVLRNAKMLTAAYKNGQVRIAKFLSTSELEYTKKLRVDCALLN